MIKLAEIYGAQFAAIVGCPPTSSQAKHYTDLATMILMILKDARVSPIARPESNPAGGPPTIPPPMTNAGGPVLGFGKIVIGPLDVP